MNTGSPYHIFALGDNALTIDFGNLMNEAVNQDVLSRFDHFRQQSLPGVIDIVPAYASLTIYYDINALHKLRTGSGSVFEWMKERIIQMLKDPVSGEIAGGDTIEIPVCYDESFAPDLDALASMNKISREDVIRLHTGRTYRIYMLGFLPGFSYMGEVDEKIMMPRKQQPQMVTAGSVGIAGRQTGIYPVSSPGGWQIIGRTPIRLLNTDKDDPVVLKAGDRVRFKSISKDEFAHY